MNKRNAERENPFQEQIAHLNQLEKLIPTNDDVAKYGLEGEEMTAICSLFVNFEGDITPVIQLIVTVLRKRKAEKPGKLLLFRDFSEFMAIMTEDERYPFIKPFLREMIDNGMLKVNRRKRVSIKI